MGNYAAVKAHITLALFGQDAGEKHDDYAKRARKYLYEKLLDIIEMDINVILDWGFGTKKEREFAREFYCSRNIPFEFHYIDIDDEEWKKGIKMFWQVRPTPIMLLTN